MKKIEKEIKKNSTELIESSLPEIDSLDKITPKTKPVRRLPLFLVPCGAALAISAIMIPVLLKQVAPTAPTTSNSAISDNPTSNSANGNSATNSTKNPISSNNNNNSSRNNNYNFVFDDYKPAFDSFSEVAYYSYFAFHQGNSTASNQLQPQRKLLTQNNETEEEDVESPKRQDYVDEYGRLHYPIPYDMEFAFSDFLYFEFDAKNSAFLEERIGNGHIYGLSVKTNIMSGETILVLKKGEYFYSCLSNGAGSHSTGGPTYIEFSAHKTIEGFDVVKDSTNKRYLTLNCGPSTTSIVDYESLSSIIIEGREYSVNPQSVFYDPTPVYCDMDELKERLEYNPDFEIFDSYGGLDTIVYDATNPETSTFTLEEFEGSFSVSQNKLYLNGTEVLALNNVDKIYASEINKDGHRDLVFESLEGSARVFNVYDIYHNKYLYHKSVAQIGAYEYYLDMRDNHVVVNLFKPGLTDMEYLLDYGRFSYGGNDGATIVWQNLYELTQLKLNGVYEADGVTPVEMVDKVHHFRKDVPYIIELELSKYAGYTNPDYPASIHQIEYSLYTKNISALTHSLSWNFLSMENGVYRYQVTFNVTGNLEYVFSFYRFNLNFKAVVNEPNEV